jgi:hypothetical protein
MLLSYLHSIGRLVEYCLTSSEQYFSYGQGENKFNNKNYIEMREVIGQPGQRPLTVTVTEKVCSVGWDDKFSHW